MEQLMSARARSAHAFKSACKPAAEGCIGARLPPALSGLGRPGRQRTNALIRLHFKNACTFNARKAIDS